MKTRLSLPADRSGAAQTAPRARGFTLVELLVVIAIISILAAMLLPVIGKVRESAKKTAAKQQMAQIVNGVTTYESTYGRLPVSSAALAAAAAKNEDFTYGNLNTAGKSVIFDVKLGATATIQATDGTGAALGYQTNNSEVMAILMDVITMPNNPALPTVNQNHIKNPQKTSFLNANIVSDNFSPGVGSDLVYRDPWGNPYIISFDLNNDDKVWDSFHRTSAVSQPGGSGSVGLAGLVLTPNAPSANYFGYSGHVMVWSAGPDKKINSNLNSNKSENKDNILSWSQ